MVITMAEDSRLRSLIGNRQRIGLGGEGILRTEGRDKEALVMLDAAYDSGIRYYDSAPAYADSERYLGMFWRQHPERKKATFQASKSAERYAAGAERNLEQTLRRLGRDHIGLWQIHDIRDDKDISQIEGPNGALRVFYNARETGIVKGIGVTGHYNPEILLYAVSSWDVDSVLLPVNIFELIFGGFLDKVIPAARERGIGVIGMKALGGGNYVIPEAGLVPETLIRFALSQDIDLLIVGCSTPGEAQILAQLGRIHTPMEDDELSQLITNINNNLDKIQNNRTGPIIAYYRGIL